MEAKSGSPRDGDAPHGSGPAMIKTYQPPKVRKWDLLFLVFASVTFGAILGLLVSLENRTVSGSELITKRIMLTFLFLPLYVFTVFPAAHSVRRVVYLRFGSPIRGSISEPHRPSTPWPFTYSVQELKEAFTRHVPRLALIPAIYFIIIVSVAPLGWTMAITGMSRGERPADENRSGIAKIAVARDIGPSRYAQVTNETQEIQVLAAIDRALQGRLHQRSLPMHECPQHHFGFARCAWTRFGSIMVRSQCKRVSGDVEMGDSYQIYKALRNTSSISPYDSLDELRGDETPIPIMSFKGTTSVTLNDLHSHTGPWSADKGCGVDGRCQITEEALKRLNRFTSLVVNPVSASKQLDAASGRAPGALLNVHVVIAELGVSGRYENGDLRWVSLDRGAFYAWDCSLDTVVGEMSAQAWSNRNSEIWEEEGSFHSGRNAVMPLDTPPGAGSINFSHGDTKYTIDRRLTDRMASHLESAFRGSSFSTGWQDEEDLCNQKHDSTSSAVKVIYGHAARAVQRWHRTNGRGPGRDDDVTLVMDTTARSLTHFLRHFNQNCSDSERESCLEDFAKGDVMLKVEYCRIVWTHIWFPSMLVGVSLLLAALAAVNEHLCHIRLPDDDPMEEADEKDPGATDAPCLGVDCDQDGVEASPLQARRRAVVS